MKANILLKINQFRIEFILVIDGSGVVCPGVIVPITTSTTRSTIPSTLQPPVSSLTSQSI